MGKVLPLAKRIVEGIFSYIHALRGWEEGGDMGHRLTNS